MAIKNPTQSRVSYLMHRPSVRRSAYYQARHLYPESFTERVMKLKILGRFLGLVKFWPTWTLSMRANTRTSQPGVPAKGPLSFYLKNQLATGRL